jgi:hypothetical protein
VTCAKGVIHKQRSLITAAIESQFMAELDIAGLFAWMKAGVLEQ